ncbi:hypothetical protein GCM10010399_85730 [Dactylosporangium fulvum]
MLDPARPWAVERPPASVPFHRIGVSVMYVPEPGHIVWAWIRPSLEEGAGGRAARIKVRAVDTDPALGDRVRLSGAELDPVYRPTGEVSVLVEPDRLWPVATEGDE